MKRVCDDIFGFVIDVQSVYDEILTGAGVGDVADLGFLGVDESRELCFEVGKFLRLGDNLGMRAKIGPLAQRYGRGAFISVFDSAWRTKFVAFEAICPDRSGS